ncbi:energy-coupling factor transporter transmembrane component T [Shewanella sp. H8]|uniref:energy-coupling factor transporter transmembrane component T n=1 Tax=Shewanella sp. H8 TaxID=3342676 RepID=UPI003316066D
MKARGRLGRVQWFNTWDPERRETVSCALSLLLVCVLSACAFVLPTSLLLFLVGINGLLVVHGVLCRGNIWGVVKLALIQLIITLGLYLILYGVESLIDGSVVVVRIVLATIPSWWLCITAAPERIGEVLSSFLPKKWAFVVAASLSLLPYMLDEIREIYQIQCLRGARITPKALRNPKNWSELVYCVLFPALILLLKLSHQMAVAAHSRHFGQHPRPTHWHSPRENDE